MHPVYQFGYINSTEHRRSTATWQDQLQYPLSRNGFLTSVYSRSTIRKLASRSIGKTSFGELELSAEIEKKISTSLRNARYRRKIAQSKLAPMLVRPGLQPLRKRGFAADSRPVPSHLRGAGHFAGGDPVSGAPHLW
ncbi:hypothetical protein [Mesorhizobium waimense]|uniref:hypothetical protein n=1 Tax=Mesorhizobium waimense TaxID=1300307 RepID=UPI0011C45573|nr:hypothetical protein [Mesorhizobium waimense]